MTLAEFLLARIAEDEREWWHRATCHLIDVGEDAGWCDCDGESRTKAECEAKRRIVDLAGRDDVRPTWFSAEPFYPESFVAGYQDALIPVLKLLALPYADHPDYRDEWRP